MRQAGQQRAGQVRVLCHACHGGFSGRAVEREPGGASEAVPDAHVVVGLDARGVDVRPGADVGEKGHRRPGERARAVGILGGGQVPLPEGRQVVRLNQGEFEVGGLAGGAWEEVRSAKKKKEGGEMI